LLPVLLFVGSPWRLALVHHRFSFGYLGLHYFFFPLAMMTAQMSRAYPEEGGLYAWTRRALGEKHGFMVSWIYWVNNIFCFPAILIFVASNLAYAIGRPELVHDTTFVLTTALMGFWVILLISLFGLKISKRFVNLGGFLGYFLPTALLIVFAIVAYIHFGGSATDFSFHGFIPSGEFVNNLSSLAMIMFAMAGIEVTATFANRVKNPKRDLYFGLLLGSLAVFALYVLATFAMNVLASPETLQQTTGFVQTFAVIEHKFHLSGLSQLIGGGIIFGELTASVVWLLAPVIMFFSCTPRGILPNWMHKEDATGTPINALLFQGVLVSVVIIITSALPSVNSMYQVLVLMTTILYFIPYLFLAIAYFRSIKAIKVSNNIGYLLVGCILFSVSLGIAVSFIPSSDLKTTHDIIVYETELVLGPLLFICAGWLLYRFRKH
jgi:amino acid transporter